MHDRFREWRLLEVPSVFGIHETYQSLCSIGCKTASSEAAQQEIENEIEV